MTGPANNSSKRRPLIGITTDVVETNGRLKADCGLAYAMCIERAGGIPILLPPIASLIHEHLRLCDGFVFTGGDDPRMEAFGVATHPQAKVIHPNRQAYELGLLAALATDRPEAPVLGICLGMQLMSLHAGGKLNQFMPDTLPTHAQHKNAEHEVVPVRDAASPFTLAGVVWSNHRQAVEHPGTLRIIAKSPDQVIEAVTDPSRPWYLGVQWHPERTAAAPLGQRILNDLVSSCSQ